MTEDKDKFQGKESMTDQELVEVHSKLNVEKHPPTQGFLSAPLIFVFVLAVDLRLFDSTCSFYESISVTST